VTTAESVDYVSVTHWHKAEWLSALSAHRG